MTLSMTGFGHGEYEINNRKFSVDIKSVNGKFLDINLKMSRQFMALEDMVRKMISTSISRGSVDVYISYKNDSEHSQNLKLDMNLAIKIKEYSDLLTSSTGIQSMMTSKDLLRFPDVLTFENTDVNVEEEKPLLEKALKIALEQFTLMRKTEGGELEKDLLNSIGKIEENVSKIEKLAPNVVEDYANKLKNRVVEILAGVELDESKLLNEIAFFVDKADINEEIVRLQSHLKQFKSILKGKEPAGKQLEFLSQEILRETNTIGSKANNLEITNLVLYQKNEVEKIKEQVRNVE